MAEDNGETREKLEKENAELRARLAELRALQSEVRRIQDAARESEERFKIIFESAPDAYYLNDLKGNFIDGNRAAEELVGYKKDTLVGRNFLKLDLLPMSYVSKAAMLLAQNALGRSTGPDEFELRRKDGSRVTVEISSFPVKISGKTVVLGIVRDISKNRRLEQDVQEIKEQLSLVLENVSEVIFRLDENGKILDVNSGVEEVFGHKQKTVVNQNFFKLGFVSAKDSPKVARFFSSAAQGKEPQIIEFESKRKDGTGLTIEANVSVIEKKNNVKELVIIARDITKG